MQSVDSALGHILKHISPFTATDMRLGDALGLTLAGDVISDVDSPPFDKALMDGYAVRAANLSGGQATLEVIEEVTAGNVPSLPVNDGQATRIMTGAPIPQGSDAVVCVEDTRFDVATSTVGITATDATVGMNIMRRGTAMKAGDRVLNAGRELRPQEIGALAELGKHRVLVRRRPRVAVLATGDELVPIDQTPGPGQIRNSNESMLAAQIARAGGEPVPLGIARDNRDDLRDHIERGLECDMLLLSGGVSAGKLDLVPSELSAAGVREIFHKVNVKPGKPVWFGVREEGGAGPTPIFGLPGNPVSSMVCFELFARTAIRRLMGTEPAIPAPLKGRFTQPHRQRGDRPTYFPVSLAWTVDGPSITPVAWQGSADLRSTVEANAMAMLPAGDYMYEPGDPIDVIPW